MISLQLGWSRSSANHLFIYFNCPVLARQVKESQLRGVFGILTDFTKTDKANREDDRFLRNVCAVY